MRFVSILAIGCLLVLAKAQKVSHGKIVVCPVVTQSILDKFFSEFNIANINLNLCTNLIVIDHQIIGIDGNRSYFDRLLNVLHLILRIINKFGYFYDFPFFINLYEILFAHVFCACNYIGFQR